MRYKHTKEELENAVKKSLAIAGVCRELNIKACGGNYKTLHHKFNEWGIDTSHFTGSAWNQGKKFTPFGKTYDLVDVLIENSPYKNTNSLKKRLFKENIKTKQCELCQLTEWNGKEIILELVSTQIQFRFLHWQTKSYAKHQAYGAFYENLDDLNYYSEFALCNPNDYLSYLYSQKCMSLRKISQPYRFDNKRYN